MADIHSAGFGSPIITSRPQVNTIVTTQQSPPSSDVRCVRLAARHVGRYPQHVCCACAHIGSHETRTTGPGCHPASPQIFATALASIQREEGTGFLLIFVCLCLCGGAVPCCLLCLTVRSTSDATTVNSVDDQSCSHQSKAERAATAGQRRSHECRWCCWPRIHPSIRNVRTGSVSWAIVRDTSLSSFVNQIGTHTHTQSSEPP